MRLTPANYATDVVIGHVSVHGGIKQGKLEKKLSNPVQRMK
jgi:hypothetical protein